MNRSIFFCFVFFLTGCAFASPTPAVGRWLRRAPMEEDRSWIGMKSYGGKIYAIGGMTGPAGRRLNLNEEYDPITDRWHYLASMPTARSAAATAEVNGVIYVIGGLADKTTTVVEAYAVANDRWLTNLPPMPTQRFDATAIAFENKIYVMGGYDDGDMNVVEVYDTVSQSWSAAPPMPTARYALQAVVIDNMIYALGGRSDNQPSDVVEVFDPKTQKWSFKTRMPEGMAGFGTVMAEGVLHVVKYDKHFTYDARTGQWQSGLPAMPTSRHGLQLAYIDGIIYAVGGCSPDGTNLFDVPSNEAYVLHPTVTPPAR